MAYPNDPNQGRGADRVGLRIKGAPSQSSNLIDFRDDSDTELAAISSAGAFSAASAAIVGAVTSATATLTGLLTAANTAAATGDVVFKGWVVEKLA